MIPSNTAPKNVHITQAGQPLYEISVASTSNLANDKNVPPSISTLKNVCITQTRQPLKDKSTSTVTGANHKGRQPLGEITNNTPNPVISQTPQRNVKRIRSRGNLFKDGELDDNSLDLDLDLFSQTLRHPLPEPKKCPKTNLMKVSHLKDWEKRILWNSINERRKLRYPVPPVFEVVSRDTLRECFSVDLCAMFSCEPPYEMDTSDTIYYVENVIITEEPAVDLCIDTALQSCTSLWDAERKPKRMTGSKCYYSWYTPKNSIDDKDFWEGKVKKFFEDKKTDVFCLERGLADEPYARKLYEEVTGHMVFLLGLFVPPPTAWFGSSGDGMVIILNGKKILIELKSPDLGMCNSAVDMVKGLHYIDSKHTPPTLRPKSEYYGQVQFGMALTGCELCHLGLYASHDNSIVIIDVPFDREFATLLLQKLTKIYFRYYLPFVRKKYCNNVEQVEAGDPIIID